MSGRFASSKHANGICDRCGWTYKLDDLREEVVKGTPTGMLTCPACYDHDHPQLRVGEILVDDPQALENPRPDNAELAAVRGNSTPVKGVFGRAIIGQVTVETT